MNAQLQQLLEKLGRPRLVRALVTLMLALTLSPRLASADPAIEAKLRFELGVSLIRQAEAFRVQGRRVAQQEKLEAALSEFLTSDRLSPNPSVKLNIGLCLEALGREDDAYSVFAELQSLASEPRDRDDAAQALARVLPKVARVSVRTTPNGAALFLDRKNLGQFGTTPRTLAAPPGAHRVIVELPGFEVETATVVLEAGREVTLHLPLRTLQGEVLVQSTPPGAEIHLQTQDGQVLGQTPLSVRLPIGRHRIWLIRSGFVSVREEVEVDATRPAAIEAVLSPAPPPKARARVLSNVADALVRVDGQEAGFTPIVFETQAGRHQIEVLKTGHQSWKAEVDLGSGEFLGLEVTLEPVAEATVTRPWPWVVLSVAGAGAIAGGIFGARALVLANDYDALPTRATYEDGRTSSLVADSLLIGSSVMGVIGLGLLVFDDPPKSQASRAMMDRRPDGKGTDR